MKKKRTLLVSLYVIMALAVPCVVVNADDFSNREEVSYERETAETDLSAEIVLEDAERMPDSESPSETGAGAENASEEQGETMEKDNAWNGNFTSQHPERGGSAVVGISGGYGGIITMDIPEHAFTEAVSIEASSKIVSAEALRRGLANDSDAYALRAVLKCSGKSMETEEDAKTIDILYNFYLLTVNFTNESGNQVKPARPIAFKVDTSSNPINLGAANAGSTSLEKNIYRINPSNGYAEAIENEITLNAAKNVSGFSFTSESSSSPFILMLAETVPAESEKKSETEEENGILTYASGVSWDCGDVTVTYNDSVLTVSGSGSMKDYSGSSYVPWNGYTNHIERIVVESGVTHIGAYCFSALSNMTEVSLPSSLVSIGSGAFYQCSKLTSVTIPNKVTEIADGAFCDCSKLSSITLGSKVESIGDYAFQGTAITTLNIPASVKTVGKLICYSCTSLKEYVVESGNSKFSSSSGVLFNKNKTELILYPVGKTSTSYTIPSTVTSIADYAFYEARNLKSITIPNTVKTIGNAVFSYCTSLTSITIPNSVTSIGNSLCYGCTALKTVVIGSGVRTLPSYAFYNCTALTSVTLSNGLVNIDYDAFYNCSSLKSLTVPSTVKNIDEDAFKKCSSLTVKLPAGIQKMENGMYVNADAVNITGKCLYSEAYKVLKQVNQERTSAGVSSLTMDKELLNAAMLRAAETNIHYSHTRPCGISCFTVSTKVCAENIASGQDSASEVMKSWMKSSGHRENILDSEFKSIGIGCFTQGGTKYWVMIFSTEKATSVKQPSDASKTFSVAVDPNEIDGVLYLNPAKTSIKAGNSTSVQIGLKTTNGRNIYAELDAKSFTWSSSSAGTVTSSGKVKGVKKGTATITAKSASGKLSASTKITVKANYDATISKLSNKKAGIEVTWSKAPSADGYYLYRKTGSGSYKKIKTIKKSGTTSYTDTSVKNKNGNTYTYKIVGYSGSKKGSASTKKIVRLTGTSLSSVKNKSSKKINVKWKKASSVTGYQIQYSTSKTFKSGNKTVKVSGPSKVSKTISKLKKGKTYYVRVRTYKKVSGKNYYSAWSGKKKVKIKK